MRISGVRITLAAVVGVFLLLHWPATADPLLRHVGDVSVPVRVAVRWLDCTPQNCVYPGPPEDPWDAIFNSWNPYAFVGSFVDAGIDMDWIENEQMVVMLAVDGAATMQPLNTVALARLDAASAGDVPSSTAARLHTETHGGLGRYAGTADTALMLEIGGRFVALGISSEGRLLVALDWFLEHSARGWDFGAATFAGTNAECREQQKEFDDIVCAGDPYPVPPVDLPPLQRPPPPIEFSLWQVVQ